MKYELMAYNNTNENCITKTWSIPKMVIMNSMFEQLKNWCKDHPLSKVYNTVAIT